MARDCYETTVAVADATGVLKALSGIKVSIVPRDAVDVAAGALRVDVYQKATGTAKGPDPATGATGTNNPITTGASGAVRFWAEAPGEYDIVFEDNTAPPRINDRTGWNAVPAQAGAIPTTVLREDGGITQKMLSAEVIRQQVPIGVVLDWWRPSDAVDPPLGYELCDGHNVTQHDFIGVVGAIQMPDLRNVFILGADEAKADTTLSDGTDATTGGPGIRGVGSSHQVALTYAQMPVHSHRADNTGGAGGYTATMNQNVSHGHAIDAADSGGAAPNAFGRATGFQHTNTGGNAYGIQSTPTGAFGWTLDARATNIDHQHAINAAGGGAAHNNMPRYYGLCKIMKCRRY